MVNIESPEDIYQNWYEGENHCAECPRRDEDRVTKPFYGFASEPAADSADVILLGEAPGGKGQPQAEDGHRTWKNFGEFADEIDPEDRCGSNDFSIGELTDAGNYSDWATFVEEFEKEWNRDRNIRLYYTNYVKCSDIHQEGWSDDGCLCHQYLFPEFSSLDPDAVIVFGGRKSGHIQSALRNLGVEHSASSASELVYDTDSNPPFRTHSSAQIDDSAIFASYHWQRGMGAASEQISDNLIQSGDGFKQRYAGQLAEAVVGSIS